MDCKSCELIARRDAHQAPLWDSVYRTDYWDVVHNYHTTLTGWLVLVARRHIISLDQLSAPEARELGELIRRTSIALKQIVHCSKTYVIQFAEHPQHPHVHVHIIPRMADMPPDKQGVNVFSYAPKLPSDQVSEVVMNHIACQVRTVLAQTKP